MFTKTAIVATSKQTYNTIMEHYELEAPIVYQSQHPNTSFTTKIKITR